MDRKLRSQKDRMKVGLGNGREIWDSQEREMEEREKEKNLTTLIIF